MSILGRVVASMPPFLALASELVALSWRTKLFTTTMLVYPRFLFMEAAMILRKVLMIVSLSQPLWLSRVTGCGLASGTIVATSPLVIHDLRYPFCRMSIL